MKEILSLYWDWGWDRGGVDGYNEIYISESFCMYVCTTDLAIILVKRLLSVASKMFANFPLGKFAWQ